MGALSALREHKAGALLVAKRDRLARDVMVAVTIERAAGAAGAQLVSVDGTGNGDTPADEFMRTIINGAAQYERALIRARTKAALAEKRARGEKLGGHVPFGYRVGEDGKTLVEDAEEQFIIKTVRAAKARGDSLRAIVGALERRGLLSRRATPLGLTQVARMAA
jgi:DNA invertase Pin-like site-specific DNA recombinase